MLRVSLITIILGVICLFSCESLVSPHCQTEAKITGMDFSRCMCCGGLILEVDGKRFLIDNAPEQFLEDIEGREFPIDVRVTVDTNQTSCLDMRIDVKCGVVLEDR